MPESNSPVRIHNHRRNLTSDSTPIQRGRQIYKEHKVKSGMTFLLDDKEETSSKMELNTHDCNHTELFVNDFRQLFRSQLENSQYPTTGNSNTSEVSSKRIENPLNRLVKV